MEPCQDLNCHKPEASVTPTRGNVYLCRKDASIQSKYDKILSNFVNRKINHFIPLYFFLEYTLLTAGMGPH